jgi:hypothetical protein
MTRKLQEKGIDVTFLATIDAANGFWSNEVNRTIPSNVNETHNFFQENSDFPFGLSSLGFNNWSRGYPATGSNVTNIKVSYVSTGVTANHTNIDEFVLQQGISQTIITKLK